MTALATAFVLGNRDGDEQGATDTVAATTAAPPTSAAPAEPARFTVEDLPDPTPIADAVDLTVDLDYGPVYLGHDDADVWVTNIKSGSLDRFTQDDGTPHGSVPGVQPANTFQLGRPAFAFGSMWATGPNAVKRIDPTTNQLVATIDIPGSTIEIGSGYISDIVVGATGVWAMSTSRAMSRSFGSIPATNALAERVRIGENGANFGISGDEAWVTHYADGPAVSRHDLVTGKELARIDLPFTPGVVWANDRGVWIQGQADYSTGPWVVGAIDPKTNTVSAVTDVYEPGGSSNFGLAYFDMVEGANAVWLSTDGGLVRVDHDRNEVSAVYAAIDGGGVTVTVNAVWYAEAGGRRLYRIPLT